MDCCIKIDLERTLNWRSPDFNLLTGFGGPSSMMSNGCLLDRSYQGYDIRNNAFMKGFVPAKPKKVT
jgi:hypothetical protein